MASAKSLAPSVSADRLSGVLGRAISTAGASASATLDSTLNAKANDDHPSHQRRRVSVEPDVSRIRRNVIDETPELRKRRLAAKTVNFTTTFIARAVILAALAYYAWGAYQFSGSVHRGVMIGMFAMTLDFGRVALKAMEPGSK